MQALNAIEVPQEAPEGGTHVPKVEQDTHGWNI